MNDKGEKTMNVVESAEKALTGYPSIDKPWLKYYSEEARNAKVPECSMYEYMMSRNRGNLSDTAINYFGKKITYGQLDEQISKCAKALAGMGIGRGDVVSLNMLAMPETVYLLYAINRLGAICNFLVLTNTAEEIGKCIATTNSKLIISVDLAAKKMMDAVEASGRITPTVVVKLSESMPFVMSLFAPKCHLENQKITNWAEFCKKGKDISCVYPQITSEDISIIAYTSGTTGQSKGVLLSNEAANALAFQYIQAKGLLEFQRKQKFLDSIPPFLSVGLFAALHTPLCVGMEVILSPDSDPKHFVDKLLKYKPNHYLCSPLHTNNIMLDRRVDKTNLSFIVTAAYGGDGANVEWEQTVTEFLHHHGCKRGLIKGYGLTEMASTFGTKGHSTEGMIPLVKNNIKVLNLDNGEEPPYGMEGEICVSGPSMMKGYLNHEEETAELIWKENGTRWMHTGDLGCVSEDGCFRITGRIKRILWTVEEGGIISRVYPMKIEDVISMHADVKRCAVVGIPNGEKGYLTKAYVVSSGADEENLRREILELCSRKLPQNSQPTEIEFINELPVTSAGKVDYRELEKRAIGQG